MKSVPLIALALSLVGLSHGLAAHTSQEALDALSRRYGPEKFAHIVSMTGSDGAPSPSEWWVVVRDLKMPSTLHTYWSGDRRVTDEGENRAYYPNRIPDGFIDRTKLKIDSNQAFAIVEREAAKERIGFNEVDYELKAISLTDEPLWSLTLIDADGYHVGHVSVSGRTGNVLRSVWLGNNRSRSGFRNMVRDSMAPSASAPVAEGPPNGGSTLIPQLPPTQIPVTPSREGDVQDIVPVPLPPLAPVPEQTAPIQPEQPARQVPSPTGQTPITPEPDRQRPAPADGLYEEITPEPDREVPGP